MKHRIGFNNLSKNVSHRQAMYRSMSTALFKYERIRTTKPKAKEIRRVAEKMISRARTDSVHNRRIIGKRIKDKAVLAKLFTDIAPRFSSRPGGYTRILKLGQRYGDASEMVLLELVERTETAPRRRKKETAKAEPEAAKAGAESGEVSAEKPAKQEKASKPAKSTAGRAKSAPAAKAKPKEPAKAPAEGTAVKSKAPAKAPEEGKAETVKKSSAAGKAAPDKPKAPAKAKQAPADAKTKAPKAESGEEAQPE